MKKTLFILLAALVLICAVACSSSPNTVTGIELDTSEFVSKNAQHLGNITKVCFTYGELAKDVDGLYMEFSLDDFKAGSAIIELEAGTYYTTQVAMYIGEEFFAGANVIPVTKFNDGDTVIVTEGELTPCVLIKIDEQ